MESDPQDGPRGKAPASQFYWKDWQSDPGLNQCSLEAHGLWINLLAQMAQSEEVGYLIVGSKPLETVEIARSLGVNRRSIDRLLAELGRYNVFSKDDRGAIFSRRMVRDHAQRLRNAEFGRSGGRPTKTPPFHQKPPPPTASSSASASATPVKDIPTVPSVPPGESVITSKPKPRPKAAPEARTYWFKTFWQDYPASPHKLDEPACWKNWHAQNLEPNGRAILENMDLWTDSRQWRQGYVPAPLKYLKKKTWTAEPPERDPDAEPIPVVPNMTPEMMADWNADEDRHQKVQSTLQNWWRMSPAERELADAENAWEPTPEQIQLLARTKAALDPPAVAQ